MMLSKIRRKLRSLALRLEPVVSENEIGLFVSLQLGPILRSSLYTQGGASLALGYHVRPLWGRFLIYHSCQQLYLKNTRHVNNWDLVDCSAEQIVGAFLVDKILSLR